MTKMHQIVGEKLVTIGSHWIKATAIMARCWKLHDYEKTGIAEIQIEIGGVQYTGFIAEDTEMISEPSERIVLVDLSAVHDDRVIGLWYGDPTDFVQVFRFDKIEDAERQARVLRNVSSAGR